MRGVVAFAGLASLFAIPSSLAQDIDFDGIDAAPDPVVVTPAVAVASQTVSVAPVAQQASAAAASVTIALDNGASSLESTPAPVEKRSIPYKRDGTCAAQPSGSGYVPTPDTPQTFLADSGVWGDSLTAPVPDGYSLIFSNLTGSLSASNYMGLYTLKSYDTNACAGYCKKASGCVSFNVYVERDPTLDPNTNNCPTPPSTSNFRCTLWGTPITAKQATNKGQWRAKFQVLIAGSNAYSKVAAPAPVAPTDPLTQFTASDPLKGAINAPLDSNGHNTYMGYTYYPFSQSQGYTPSTCAAACLAQTAYDKAHPAADGSFMACLFFNAYVLNINGVPQGLYCSNYNTTWSSVYA
ncbi:hypothetical protein E4T43_02060 [Aureobasidium subglaciale]|nr:hypothetical protein E4T43_02060 [Aureobasidium subglaciale]